MGMFWNQQVGARAVAEMVAMLAVSVGVGMVSMSSLSTCAMLRDMAEEVTSLSMQYLHRGFFAASAVEVTDMVSMTDFSMVEVTGLSVVWRMGVTGMVEVTGFSMVLCRVGRVMAVTVAAFSVAVHTGAVMHAVVSLVAVMGRIGTMVKAVGTVAAMRMHQRLAARSLWEQDVAF